MISRPDLNDPLKPVHLHDFDEEGRPNLRVVCRDHIPRRSRASNHRPIFAAAHVKARLKRSRRSYYGTPLHSIDEDFWSRPATRTWFPASHKYHFQVTNIPTTRDFYINWPQIFARDVPKSSAGQKTPKTRDHNARLEFAKSIGLSKLPPASDNSFTQLYGLFDEIMKSSSEHDSVETVRRIRRE